LVHGFAFDCDGTITTEQIFRHSCLSYDFHRQSLSYWIMAFSLLISQDYVTTGLPHEHEPNFSQSLENLSPRQAWKSRGSRQLCRYLTEFCFLRFCLCLYIFQIEPDCILNVLQRLCFDLAFAETAGELNASCNKSFSSLCLKRRMVISSFHKRS